MLNKEKMKAKEALNEKKRAEEILEQTTSQLNSLHFQISYVSTNEIQIIFLAAN